MLKTNLLLTALALMSACPAVVNAEPAAPTPPTDQVFPGKLPMILWRAPDVYVVPGEGEILTNDCTVDPDGLTAKLQSSPRPWLYFYDRDGRLEADCQVLTKPRPVVIVRAEPVQRAIGVIGR